jgi:hypothetical protein
LEKANLAVGVKVGDISESAVSDMEQLIRERYDWLPYGITYCFIGNCIYCLFI